jgi:hypothetical protein
MLRVVGILCAMVAVGLFLSVGAVAQAQNTTKKNQMVKGTIKSVDAEKDLLVILQKVKAESVDRELSITADTEVTVTAKGETKTASGKAGLQLLEGLEGSSVQVKCDKDVNVLSVKVKAK